MATSQQKELAIIYRDAASEHVGVAQELYRSRQFVLANYIAGLATECILRAYRQMIDAEFDSRHDLQRLYVLSQFENAVPETQRRLIGIALTTTIALWANDHRFLSERAFRLKLKKMRLDRGIKGDFVKERTRQLVNAATEIVTLGVERWKSYFGK